MGGFEVWAAYSKGDICYFYFLLITPKAREVNLRTIVLAVVYKRWKSKSDNRRDHFESRSFIAEEPNGNGLN